MCGGEGEREAAPLQSQRYPLHSLFRSPTHQWWYKNNNIVTFKNDVEATTLRSICWAPASCRVHLYFPFTHSFHEDCPPVRGVAGAAAPGRVRASWRPYPGAYVTGRQTTGVGRGQRAWRWVRDKWLCGQISGLGSFQGFGRDHNEVSPIFVRFPEGRRFNHNSWKL